MTIKERAEKYANERCKECYVPQCKTPCGAVNDRESDYIRIATEQRKIDVEEICTWLEENANEFIQYDGRYKMGSLTKYLRIAIKE